MEKENSQDMIRKHRNRKSKISMEDLRKMKEMSSNGFSQDKIASIFSISQALVSLLLLEKMRPFNYPYHP